MSAFLKGCLKKELKEHLQIASREEELQQEKKVYSKSRKIVR